MQDQGFLLFAPIAKAEIAQDSSPGMNDVVGSTVELSMFSADSDRTMDCAFERVSQLSLIRIFSRDLPAAV
jgi:hypothetical protein